MTLEKAKLIPKDGGAPTIEFMFNPTEITFARDVKVSENQASRNEQGDPKVAFGSTTAYKVTINKILFDTYETGEDVVKTYISKFRAAVEFPEGGQQEKPPVYTFIWGSQVYLRTCMIENLTYKLTLFGPDGTPLRAMIDSLTLKQAEPPKPKPDTTTPSPDTQTRQQDTLESRKNGRSSSGASSSPANP